MRSKWWALAIPSWVCMAVAYTWFAYDRSAYLARILSHATALVTGGPSHHTSPTLILALSCAARLDARSVCALRAVAPSSRGSVYDSRSVFTESDASVRPAHSGAGAAEETAAAIPAISDIPLTKARLIVTCGEGCPSTNPGDLTTGHALSPRACTVGVLGPVWWDSFVAGRGATSTQAVAWRRRLRASTHGIQAQAWKIVDLHDACCRARQRGGDGAVGGVMTEMW